MRALVFLGMYKEFGQPTPVSIMDSLGLCPDSIRDGVAGYLDSGVTLIAATSFFDDVIDTDRLRIAQRRFLTDGYFVWPGCLGYYVREYGLEVPRELVDRALMLGDVQPLLGSELQDIYETLVRISPVAEGC